MDNRSETSSSLLFYAKTTLYPKLIDSTFLPPELLPQDLNILIASLFNEDIPIFPLTYLPRIQALGLSLEQKVALCDFFLLLSLSELLKISTADAQEIHVIISNLSESPISKPELYRASFPQILNCILTSTSASDLTKYLSISQCMNKIYNESIENLIYYRLTALTSQVFDKKGSVLELAQGLCSLQEFKGLQRFEGLKKFVVERFFCEINKSQIKTDLEKRELIEALRLLEDFFLEKHQQETYLNYIAKYSDVPSAKIIEFNSDFNLQLYFKDSLTEKLKNLPVINYKHIQVLELIYKSESAFKSVEVFKVMVSIQGEDKIAALKCNYSKQFDASFQIQANFMLAMHGHSNFLEIFGSFNDFDEEKKLFRYNLVMEFIPMTLRAKIENWERKSPSEHLKQKRERETFNAATQLISAMRALNQQNVSHRDLKPDNILVTSGKVYKITDFDVSNKFERDSFGDTQQITGKLIGTERYLSPELWNLKNASARGRINYNKSDVFSLGLTLLRMVTNRDCNSWNCLSEFLQKNLKTIINKEVGSKSLKGILKKMLIVDINKRKNFKDLELSLNEISATMYEN